MSSQALFCTLLTIYSLPQISKTQSGVVSPDGATLFITQKSAMSWADPFNINHPNIYPLNKTFDVAPAAFGFSKYSGTVQGVLILPANETYHRECATLAEPLGFNPYIHYINDWFISTNEVTDYIVIIDRGDCMFVEKVEQAQSMGASAAIICDFKYENLFSIWQPADWKDDIHIPTVLLSRDDCAIMMQHIGVENWDPILNPQNMTYPNADAINWIIGTIQWGLPHPNDKVEWQFWTSSNDVIGSQFRRDFQSTAIVINQANDTIFTPHMYILNGSHWQCDESSLPCRKQCTNSGRYCAVDPEYDLTIGVDGMDVIQENLRSLCVWEYDKVNFGKMEDIMWWNYSLLWDDNCGILGNDTVNTFNQVCSYTQMDKLDGSQKLKSYAQNCVTSSGGYGYNDGVNSILNRELRIKTNSSIYSIPTVVVNDFQIQSVNCKPPITKSSCEVLAAICNDFIDGTEPDICSNIIGCDGIPYSNKILNPCGVCVSSTDPNFNNYGQDCRAICTTIADTHYIDNCGQCLLPSDPNWNYCLSQTKMPTGKPTATHFNACLQDWTQSSTECADNYQYIINSHLMALTTEEQICCAEFYEYLKDLPDTTYTWYAYWEGQKETIDMKHCEAIFPINDILTGTYECLCQLHDVCDGLCVDRIQSEFVKITGAMVNTNPYSISYNLGVTHQDCQQVMNRISQSYYNPCGETQIYQVIQACATASTTGPTKTTSNIPTTDPTVAIKETYMPTSKPTDNRPTTYVPTYMPTTPIPTLKPIITTRPTSTYIPTFAIVPTIYQLSTTKISTHMATPRPTNYHSYDATSNVENETEHVRNSISMVMILFIVIGILILVLCLCGVYILYVKYKKNRDIHLDYIQNIIAVEGEGDIDGGEQDYDESMEGDVVFAESQPATVLAQTNKL